jgi:hypothetical protein
MLKDTGDVPGLITGGIGKMSSAACSPLGQLTAFISGTLTTSIDNIGPADRIGFDVIVT